MIDKIIIVLKQGYEIAKFGGLSRISIPMANFIKLVPYDEILQFWISVSFLYQQTSASAKRDN